jgi:hypothetical protein
MTKIRTKHRPPNAGRGRPKGAKNKLTVGARLALETTFTEIGGVPAFADWARKNPAEFYKLWSKLVPKDVEVSGPDGTPVAVRATIRWGDTEIPI